MMNASFFAGNRQRLYEQFKPNSLAIFTAFVRMQDTNDYPATFHQEGNFWYLTGIEEPDWRLLVDTDSGEEWLVAPHVSFVHQAFDGSLTPQEASRISGIKTVLDKKSGGAKLNDLLSKKKRAYTILPQNMRFYGFVPNPAQRRLVRQLKDAEIIDTRLMLAKMRAIKQPIELEQLQKAVDITIDGIQAVLSQLKTMRYEYQADAVLTYELRKRGVVHGFEPIIAAGKNTCVLHHPLPKDPFVPNDWLLMDVGAKVNGYTADITRTIPIGKPSARHLQVYQAVQRIHAHTFETLKAGEPVRDYFKQAYHYVGEELQKLGLIQTIKLDYSSVFKYMPHAISHGLGIDVHDPLGRPETFTENMVVTVEVGTYIPEEGIGVRLEDDVVITKTGAKNLSGRLPIELEKLRAML